MTPLQEAEARLDKAKAQVERIERDARTVNWLVWGAVVLAALPPLFGVTKFAVDEGVSRWVAWVIDPSFIVVIAASIAAHESLSRASIAAHESLSQHGEEESQHGGEKIGFWLHLVPWLAAGASLCLNIAAPLHLDDPRPVDVGGVAVHGLPSLVTICIIEAASSYRARIRRRLTAVHDVVAHAEQELRVLQAEADAQHQVAERELAERERQDQARQQEAAARERAAERAHALELARLTAVDASPGSSGPGTGKPPPADSGPRRLTQEALDAIAREIAAQIQATPGWEPDYERLQRTYVRGRRWCEDRVAAARLLVDTPDGSEKPRLHAVGAEG